MTEKEKTKAYDEAIERAKKLYSKGIAEEIFPELKESEDDKIRKEIISILRNAYWTSNKNRFNELVAWFEKQRDKDKLIQELGEYKVKYTQEVLENYMNSMSNKDDERLRNTAIAFLKDFAEQGYENAVECIDWLEKNGKDKWTIKDAKDGDVIQLGKVTAIFKKYIGREKCICYCSFCKDVNFEGFEIPIENGDDNVYGGYNATPATKEQRDVLMKAMNDAGYEWDAEKKELKKLVSNRFDPKTFKPFDKVLIRRGSESYNVWFPDFVSEPPNDFIDKTLCMCVRDDISIAIPYNDDTKHLVGTTNEAPEYYRYWEI